MVKNLMEAGTEIPKIRMRAFLNVILRHELNLTPSQFFSDRGELILFAFTIDIKVNCLHARKYSAKQPVHLHPSIFFKTVVVREEYQKAFACV